MPTRVQAIKKVYVVSHTHWDREWYQDFQGFRARLVYLIDELIDKMERDEAYKFFTMDGQTIVIDDYLAIRPENQERLMALIRQGRIIVGPWYVMPDEFLVSGESLIRNLMIGMGRTARWGGEPLRSGYVTDIFGHNSQMPQLLRGFGIDNAVLFRGFEGNEDPSEIWWEGADGSRVLGLKLDEDRAYGDFYFFMRWPFADRDYRYEPSELEERKQAMLAYKSKRATTDIVLGLDGVDHAEIEPQLPWMLEMLSGEDSDVQFVHATIDHYLAELRTKISQLKVYKGELRNPGYNGINNWTPANVLSSRIHLKQNNHRCEMLLERWAEPWSVFAAFEGLPYPNGFLRKSWEHLIQNHPHDSICGCSIDQVHRDMIYRFDQSRLISEQMIGERLQYIASHIDNGSLDGDYAVTIFNPSGKPVAFVARIELMLPAGQDAFITHPHLGGTSFIIRDAEGNEVPYQVLDVKKSSVRRIRKYRDIPGAESVDRFRLALGVKVPSFGYSTYTVHRKPFELPLPGQYDAPMMLAPVRYQGTMKRSPRSWDNGCCLVTVNANGTVRLEDYVNGRTYDGLNGFEDEADIGDGWSHVPPVTNETFCSTGASASISVVHDGPFLAEIKIQRVMKLPLVISACGTRRSDEMADVPITSWIEIRQGDPIVRVRTVIVNRSRDHRLTALFPTMPGVDSYYTSTPFDWVKRSIDRNDYSEYLNPARSVVPHNGIVATDDGTAGLAVLSKGLYEAALRDDGAGSIALTLFRSTRSEVLSDGGDGGQLLGELVFEYALRPYTAEAAGPGPLFNDYLRYDAELRTEQRKLGAVIYETPHRRAAADLPAVHSYMEVMDGAGWSVSAVKMSEEEPDAMIVRIVNVSNARSGGRIRFDRAVRSAVLTDLNEHPVESATVTDGEIVLVVEPKRICTVKATF